VTKDRAIERNSTGILLRSRNELSFPLKSAREEECSLERAEGKRARERTVPIGPAIASLSKESRDFNGLNTGISIRRAVSAVARTS